MVVRLAALSGPEDSIYDLAIDMTRGPEGFLRTLEKAVIGRSASKS